MVSILGKSGQYSGQYTDFFFYRPQLSSLIKCQYHTILELVSALHFCFHFEILSKILRESFVNVATRAPLFTRFWEEKFTLWCEVSDISITWNQQLQVGVDHKRAIVCPMNLSRSICAKHLWFLHSSSDDNMVRNSGFGSWYGLLK